MRDSLDSCFLVLGISAYQCIRSFFTLKTFVFSFSHCRLAGGAEKRKRESLVLRMRPFRVAYSHSHTSLLYFTWHWTGKRGASLRHFFTCIFRSFIWKMYFCQIIMFHAALNLVWYTDYSLESKAVPAGLEDDFQYADESLRAIYTWQWSNAHIFEWPNVDSEVIFPRFDAWFVSNNFFEFEFWLSEVLWDITIHSVRSSLSKNARIGKRCGTIYSKTIFFFFLDC